MNYESFETLPESIRGHRLQRTYNITGITPNEFLMGRGRHDFDLDDLKKTFASHCPDYMKPIDANIKSKAKEFCDTVMLKVEPEYRKSKGICGSKVWKCTFINNEHKHEVFISRYSNTLAEFADTNNPYNMILTIQQACLIAHETFARQIELSFQSGQILMTPLAETCFKKDDIGVLAKSLGLTEVDLLIRMSQSVQRGGHYLDNSDVDIAICGWIMRTRNMEDVRQAQNVVVKVIKMYMIKGKVGDPSRIVKIGLHTTAEIRPAFAYEKLLDLMNSKQ